MHRSFQQWVLTAVLPLVVLWSVVGMTAADSPRYRVVSERKIENLEKRLRGVAAEGYGLVGSGAGSPKLFRSVGVVRLLLERLPAGRKPPEYLVVEMEWNPREGRGLEELKEAGTRGFRVPEHGVVERVSQAGFGAPSTLPETVLVLEMTEPVVRMEYALEPFPRNPGEWPALATRIAEGFQLVAPCFQMNGAILARPVDAEPVAGIRQDRFKLIAGWGKKKMAARLDAACHEGFRLVSTVRVMHWPPFGLLLEKTAAPGQDYAYRLPKGGWDLEVMNESGREGFHVHRLDPWVMERDLTATAAYEYQRLEASSTVELAKGMESMVKEGWGFVCFCPGPDTMLLERTKPAED